LRSPLSDLVALVCGAATTGNTGSANELFAVSLIGEERATSEFLGRIGCLNPEGFPAFEIAYTLGPWRWGKGYAREGAAAALRYARETLGRTEITSIIRPGNAASIRVATSLGAVASESVEFFGLAACGAVTAMGQELVATCNGETSTLERRSSTLESESPTMEPDSPTMEPDSPTLESSTSTLSLRVPPGERPSR
jgi:Acetyltransferase (GNAT) domain